MERLEILIQELSIFLTEKDLEYFKKEVSLFITINPPKAKKNGKKLIFDLDFYFKKNIPEIIDTSIFKDIINNKLYGI